MHACRRAALSRFVSFRINQAPWYIKQRVKTVTELARHSSENTLSLSLSPRPPFRIYSPWLIDTTLICPLVSDNSN